MHRRFAFVGFAVLGALAIAIGVSFVQVIQSHRATHTYVTERVPATLKLLKLDTDLFNAQLSLVRATRAESDEQRRNHLTAYSKNVDQAIDRFNAFGDLAESEKERQMLAQFKQARTDWLQRTASLRHLLESDAAPGKAEAALQQTIDGFQAMQDPIDRIETRFHDPLAKGTAIQTQDRFLTMALMAAVIAGMAISAALLVYYVWAIQRQQRELTRRDEQRAREHQKRHFETRLNDALSMASSESSALRLMTEAIREVHPQGPAEILLADASNAHLHQAATTDTAEGRPGCPVSTPSACPAVQRGHELTFDHSDDFDVCPHLRDRPDGPCSATCVPISIMGQAVGVLHATGENQSPAEPEQTERLALLASKTSERIGMLRAFEQTHNQATTDPLTGLANRRHLEAEIHALQREQVHYTIAYIDLDHFKQLNDTHGHDTGDRALRLFSRVLRETIRPTDHACRWGGEEFIVLLPRTDAALTTRVMQRISTALSEALERADTPSFTISAGVSENRGRLPFDEVLAAADAALMRAKEAGRARIEIAETTGASDPVETELSTVFHGPTDEGTIECADPGVRRPEANTTGAATGAAPSH
jgi:diguanylate cyclase (GGDEF)-like protein